LRVRYCLDTSVFINGWNKRYRVDVFPSLWQELNRILHDGTAFSCDEVYRELAYQDDALSAWAKERKQFFEIPTEETVLTVRELIHNYPNFAAQGGTGNEADPWLIAHARLANAVVVTDEQAAPNLKSTKPPKIPNICELLPLRWMTPIEFFAANNFLF
jgi:hypothetical protein